MKVRILGGKLIHFRSKSTRKDSWHVEYTVQIERLDPIKVGIMDQQLQEKTEQEIFEIIKERLGLTKIKGLEKDITGKEFEV